MASLAQKSQQQDYLKKLLGKQEPKANTVQNYLKLAQNNYEQKIRTGSFKVKQTSDRIETNKNNHRSKADAQNMKFMKKSLEKTLKLIDSRIQQLTQPDKKSKKIDDQERLKFVSQMTKARRQLQKKRDQKFQEYMQKNKQQLAKELQEERKREEEQKKKRKQQAIKRTQSLDVMRRNKKNQMQNQNKELKVKLEQKTLLQRMNERYKKQQQNLLQQRKKKLAEIRSIHKPLTKSQFELHIQKIDKLKSQRSRVIEKSQMSKYISNDSNNIYKSSWYEKTKKQQVTYEDERHEQQLLQVKQMKDKLKKYSEYVRQNFKPEIDIKKSKQFQQKNKTKSAQGPKTQDLRQLGLKYLQWSKQHVDPTKKNSESDEQQKNKIIKPKNYLEQLKKNSKGIKNPNQFLEQVKKKNIPQSEKAQKILDYAQNLERKAKLRQQKAKINNMVVDEELDNMYMQAIQMKLKMLGNKQKE